jgi:hypothetical protein
MEAPLEASLRGEEERGKIPGLLGGAEQAATRERRDFRGVRAERGEEEAMRGWGQADPLGSEPGMEGAAGYRAGLEDRFSLLDEEARGASLEARREIGRIERGSARACAEDEARACEEGDSPSAQVSLSSFQK